MGVRPKTFAGISTRIPGVYAKQEFPQSKGAGIAGNIVAIVGESLGGVPYNAADQDEDANKLNYISSVSQAVDQLIGGNGFYATEMYLNPTLDPALGQPASVIFVRVNPATRAVRTLEDAASDDVIDIKANRYGAIGNQISMKVEAATNLGHKVTVKFKGDTIAEKDDVGFEYLDIQYTGAGTAATMTISATQLTTSVTGASGEDLTINFSEFTNLGDLVAFINEQSVYTCTLKGKSDDDTTTFDAVTTQDIKTAVYTAVAHVEAMIQFLNDESGGELVASLTASAVRDDVANDTTFVFLTTGSDGTVSNTHWAGALDLLKKFSINHVITATDDSTIHAMLRTHLHDMSSVAESKYRTGGCGAAIGDTVANKKTAAKALNSYRMEYWGTPFKRPDILNGNEAAEFDPFYMAAMTAGIRFANHTTMSSTYKLVNVVGLTESYDRTAADALLAEGVSLLTETERGFEVLRDVTTHQGSASDNEIKFHPAGIRTADYVTLDIIEKSRLRMANLKQAPNALVIKDMENYIYTNLLPSYETSGHFTADPNTGEPAFKDVEFELNADSFSISFSAIIPLPLLFIFLTEKFTVVGQ